MYLCIEFIIINIIIINILYSLLFEFQNMRSTYLSKFLEKRFSARMATYVLPEPVGK